MIIETKQIASSTFLTIKNEAGMEVTLSSFGAGIYQIKIDDVPMLVGIKDYQEWMFDKAYHGKCVGRFAGRIKDGLIKIGDKTYQLSQNERKNTLHGGQGGFSFREFSVDMHNLDDELKIDFYYTSKDLEEGFPGEITTRVRYTIPEDKTKLLIEFKSVSEKETPIDLTIHSYFNLGGNKNILSDKMYVDADEILTYDDELLPQKYIEIPSQADLREKRELKEIIKDPYFQKEDGVDTAYHSEGRDIKNPQVILENDQYMAIIKSSYDDVVIYTSNCPPFGMEMNNGQIQEQYSSVAIEPQCKSMDLDKMILKPHEAQRNFIEYEFIKKE